MGNLQTSFTSPNRKQQALLEKLKLIPQARIKVPDESLNVSRQRGFHGLEQKW